MFAEKPGVQALNADDEAKRLMVEDDALRRKLIERFGSETYRADGSLNREGLADRIFGNSNEVAALNALVHPVVLNALRDSIGEARRVGIDLFVYEVALLTEIGVADVVDAVLLVDAPLDTRILRVMERNGLSREDIIERVQHQVSPDAIRGIADYVIDNSGDLDNLRASVDEVYRTLTST